MGTTLDNPTSKYVNMYIISEFLDGAVDGVAIDFTGKMCAVASGV